MSGHDKIMKPKLFVGAATSAHQVEGNNIHSDVWAMEQMEHSSFSEKSLIAVDHYERFAEDIRLLAEAGLNAYRFSIEWARIEPEEGKFDEKEVEHYRKVLQTCHTYCVRPIVTLHHFSSPKWLISSGGWECQRTIFYFSRYCGYIAERLGHLMEYVCTINEANMGIQIAALAKQYKRQADLQIGLNLKQFAEYAKYAEEENWAAFGTPKPAVFLNERTHFGDQVIIQAHKAAKEKMKCVCPWLKIGITLSLHDIQVAEDGEECAEQEWKNEFLHYVPYLREDDFIGIQNYTRTVMGKDGPLSPPKDAALTQMGYEIYPQALESVIRKVYEELKIPIIVTENGIATSDDDARCRFIELALQGVDRCILEGIPVLGYTYWSLLDNYEWQKGYGMTFGLIAVDRSDMRRTKKRSLYALGEIARKHCE